MAGYRRIHRVSKAELAAGVAVTAQPQNFVERLIAATEEQAKALRMDNAKAGMDADAKALAFAKRLDEEAEEFAELLRSRHAVIEGDLPPEMLVYQMEHRKDMHIVDTPDGEYADTAEQIGNDHSHEPKNTGLDDADQWLLNEEIRRMCAEQKKSR